jgi:hypothetical protein
VTAHEWLSEVLLSLAFRLGGWSGVVLLTGAAGEEWRRLARIALPATVAAVRAIDVVRLMMPIERTDSASAPISALSAGPPGLRSKPALNDYAFGGFLIFEHGRPFIDSRAELYGDGMLSLYDKLQSDDREAVEGAQALRHCLDPLLS